MIFWHVMQNFKAWLVSWNNGRQVATVPQERLSFRLFGWFRTSAGTLAALWLLKQNATALENLPKWYESNIIGSLDALNQQGHGIQQFFQDLNPSLHDFAGIAVRLVSSPVYLLGEAVAFCGWLPVLLAKALGLLGTSLQGLPPLQTVLLSVGLGLAVFVATVVLSQRLDRNKGNWELLREDFQKLLRLVPAWTMFGTKSVLHTRFASEDVQVSFGESSQSYVVDVCCSL